MTTRTIIAAVAVLVFAGSLLAKGPALTVVKEPTKEPAANSPLDLKVQDINGKETDLKQYKGKVVLIVNVASKCGNTPQYKGLEALDSKYRARGFVVLGFPSNDFAQESGSNQEIADFCENTFGVKFPMFAKSSVRGADANPLFKQLAQLSGTTPKWNFYKYLIGRDGKVVDAYSSLTSPDDRRFVKDVEKQLGAN